MIPYRAAYMQENQTLSNKKGQKHEKKKRLFRKTQGCSKIGFTFCLENVNILRNKFH